MKLKILVGNIGSGKSTYSQKIIDESIDPVIVLNDDALISMVSNGRYFYQQRLGNLYDYFVLALLRETINTYRLRLDDNEWIVLVDCPNESIDDRNDIIDVISEFDFSIDVEFVVFPRESPKEHARRRYESDNRGYAYQQWLNVAELCDAQYEDVTNEEVANYNSLHKYRITRL